MKVCGFFEEQEEIALMNVILDICINEWIYKFVRTVLFCYSGEMEIVCHCTQFLKKPWKTTKYQVQVASVWITYDPNVHQTSFLRKFSKFLFKKPFHTMPQPIFYL